MKASMSPGQEQKDDRKGSGEYARPAEQGRPAILLVDDTPANLLALEAVLSPLGHRLVRASSGEDALRCMLKEEFCLALVDVQMGGMDGFETAALIKSHPRIAQTPVIFVTAISGEARHVLEGYSRGAVDYLVKPFEPYVLRSKVSVFVDLYLRGKRIQEQDRLLRQQELNALRLRSEERYRGLAESVPVVVWAVGPEGIVHYCNEAWTSYSGIAFESNSDVLDARFVHAEDLARARNTWRAARGSGTQWEIEYRLRRRDGQYRWHLGRALPEYDGKGGISGWIVTATDIDERKRTDDLRVQLLQQEQRAREEAEATNRAKDEFLATVSHELRAPLNAILGWVQMLRQGMLNEDRSSHALETIHRNAQIQCSLVEDLLDVSRIIAGKVSLDTMLLSFGRVAEAAIEAAKPAATAKGISIESSLSCGHDEVLGDPRRLQQALGNLLANAVKFTPSGGRISVELSNDTRTVSIRVTDTGIGIRTEFLPHVFDRFRQADGSSTRAHGGLGLGLAIVRHIAKLHGGSVTAESRGVGMGASLTLTLPVELRPSERTLRASTPVPGLSLEGLHVMIVDDEADARELAEVFLRARGARVTTAASAEEALPKLRELRPDIFVSDIGMPQVNGLTLMRRIRELPRDEGGEVPAIAVTGLASSEDTRQTLAAGYQEHLPKPLQLDKLLEVVSRLGRPGTLGNRKDREEGVMERHGM
jgi:PAS domain S-box-containing protein